MDIPTKKSGNLHGNKEVAIIPTKISRARKLVKKENANAYPKLIETRKKSASRPKQTVLQSTTLIKDATNVKSLNSKSSAHVTFPIIKNSKTVGKSNLKTGAVRKQKVVPRTNQNISKMRSKSNKVENKSFNIRKLDNGSIASTSINLDEQSSNRGECHETPENKLRKEIHNLKVLTEVDESLTKEKSTLQSERMTGAIPKISRKENDYKQNCSETRRRDTMYNLNSGTNKDKDEQNLKPCSPSFHRDRIASTLDELDQIMDSENMTSTSTVKYKKSPKIVKKKKIANLKTTSTTSQDKMKLDNDNFDNSATSQVFDAPENRCNGVDKYLCSLSGGEARILTSTSEKLATQAIDITEKIHTPDVSLNQKSFPQSSNSTTDNDVSFLLGKNLASRISSNQKSIADKWKPKQVCQESESQYNPNDDSQTKHEDDDTTSHDNYEVDNHGTPKKIGQTGILNLSQKPHGHEKDTKKFALPVTTQDFKIEPCEKVKNKDDQEEDNDVIEELSCPICYEALHVPQELEPCKHIFCDPCLRRMADAPRTEAAGCPMCRTEIKSCTTKIELVKQIKEIYPKQYKAREETEEASGVFDLPLPPSPPKLDNPFSLSGDGEEFGTSGGIVMQMPTGQFVVMPLTPTTATVGVIVEMLELAYLSNVLQLLRQRSHNLEEMLLESRRMYEGEPSLASRFQRRTQISNPSSRFTQQFPPTRFRLISEQRPGQLSEEREESRSRASTDPLDFNQFMDDVYQQFPFN